MTQNPLNELKRRLDSDPTTPRKRLCLPTALKEKIVSEWLHGLIERNSFEMNEEKMILDSLLIIDDWSVEMKSKLMQDGASTTPCTLLAAPMLFRQHKTVLESLQKELVICLAVEEFLGPSNIIIIEVLSAILSTFIDNSKMADHTVPEKIANDFWHSYSAFEDDCLNKFGLSVLKASTNPSLILSYLKLCLSFAQLKLLNIKYSYVKLDISTAIYTSELFDLSVILPCMNKEQWIELVTTIEDHNAVVVLDNLLSVKTMACQLLIMSNREDFGADMMTSTKTHLIKQINECPTLLQSNHFCQMLFTDLDKTHAKLLAKCLIKFHLENPESKILQSDAISNNRILLNFLVLETAKNITKCFENNGMLCKMLGKSNFCLVSFAKEVDIVDYFSQVQIKQENEDDIKNYVNILKQLQLYYLDENYQLVAIFLLLAIKKSTNAKKLKRTIDNILQSVYELSLQQPDLYQIFPVDYIFSFQDNTFYDLLILKLKNSNNLLVIKSLLELAVKKVRVDSQLVKSIVKKVLKKNKTKIYNMDSFNDSTFQVTCLILPLIVKQKKALTASAYRSILTNLQEKLHKTLLESFKNIDFSNDSFLEDTTGITDGSVVESESNIALLHAMPAYALALSKYCETSDIEEIKNLDCLWSGLGFFTQSAIKCIENITSKPNHIESSANILNVILRHIKKLETHSIFQDKDKLFLQMYRCIKSRLIHEQTNKVLSSSSLEDLGVSLKFVCELSSVECYGNQIIGDLSNLAVLKKPSIILSEGNTDVVSRKVFKYIWCQSLKANIIGSKCVAMSKLMHRVCKNLRNWIRQHYDSEDSVARVNEEISTEEHVAVKIVKVDDTVCDLIRLDLDSLSELILAAKKVSLDYKFLDSIFELQHLVHHILHKKCTTTYDISWNSFFTLYEGCISVLNSLIIAREEILEDRWACYMQCYRALVCVLCERAMGQVPLDPLVEERLADTAHHIEKLTQSIAKRKKHVSRIAAYTVADLCASLESNAPTKTVRQHLENSVILLIQASDSSYTMPFLKRALAGSPGQTTLTNLYTMYKRYHKYVGNA